MHTFMVGARKGITSGGAFKYEVETAIEAAAKAYSDKLFDNIPFASDSDKLYIIVTCFDETLMGGWWFHLDPNGTVIPYIAEDK